MSSGTNKSARTRSTLTSPPPASSTSPVSSRVALWPKRRAAMRPSTGTTAASSKVAGSRGLPGGSTTSQESSASPPAPCPPQISTAPSASGLPSARRVAVCP
ncbi:MAG: hypothetical protein A2138_14205 [Deltaproteobacteria bacterium RBG_16_71_12]|nr:MAG: hypothetical protein A2138_14205 [Deltaproteobacteria bacterium RBG_16_71_12]